MCKNVNCIDKCPGFSGTCKLFKARRMRFINTLNQKNNIFKTKMYNFKVNINTIFYNLKINIKNTIKNRKIRKKIRFIDRLLDDKPSFLTRFKMSNK